jgi:hypothetical protein
MELRRAYQYAHFLVNNFLRRSPVWREQGVEASIAARVLSRPFRDCTSLPFRHATRVNYLNQTHNDDC